MAMSVERAFRLTAGSVAAGLLFVPLQVHPQKLPAPTESGISPDVAAAIATFGIEFVIGTFSIISNDKKSSIPSADAKEIGKQGTALLDRYNRSVREGAFGANLLHPAISVGIVSGTVMGSSTVAGAAPAAALAVVAQTANGKVRDYLVGDSIAKASAVLSKGIDSMTAEQRARIVELVQQGNHEEAADYFEASTKLLSKMRSAVANDPEATKLLNHAVSDSLRKGSADAIRLAGQAVASVADLEGQFTAHVQGVTAFTKKVAASLVVMENGIDGIRTELATVQSGMQTLADAQASTNLQVQVIQDVLFDQQPAIVKLEMLNGGAKPGLTSSQRKTLAAALSIQVKQQKLVSHTAEIVGYARDVNTILGNFGVQDARLDQAVQYGTAATTAMQQAFGGNYIGAIATVSGLFGGARPDPVQEQFKRVFAEFSKINEKLDRVLDFQIETLKSIEALSRQMAEMQRRMDHRFDRVDFELARLNEAAQVLVWDKLNPCGNAWKVQNEPGPRQYDPVEGRFLSYQATFAYTSAHGDKAFKCADALDALFYNYRRQSFAGNPLSLSFVRPLLDAAGVPKDTKDGQYGVSALENYRDRLHAPSFRVLEHGWSQASVKPGWGNLASAYALLSTPAGTVDHLTERIDAMQSGPAASACKMSNSLVGRRIKVYLCSDLNAYDEQEAGHRDQQAHSRARAYLSDPLVRDQVGELTKFAMLVAGPRELAKSDAAPGAFTLNDLGLLPAAVSYGRPLLEGALMVSDASIAQLSMIYGDLTAWFVFDMLWDKQTKRFRNQSEKMTDQETFNEADQLLKNNNNPWLQRNVLMLILRSSEIACNSAPTGPACTNRSLLYHLAHNKYFPQLHAKNDDPILVMPNESEMEAAEATLKQIFDLHPDVRFAIEDYAEVGQTKISIPRRIQMKVDGYSLTMPSVVDWTQRRLVYPPFMIDRLADRLVVARRLANYAALDGMESTSRATLVTILSKGEP